MAAMALVIWMLLYPVIVAVAGYIESRYRRDSFDSLDEATKAAVGGFHLAVWFGVGMWVS